ncbi:MAG: hypothetical protein U1E33_03885 [Rhodospirillales bacterium]
MAEASIVTPGSAASGEDIAEGDEASGRNLPADAAAGFAAFPLADWHHSLLRETTVAVKSLEIFISGARVCNAAAFAMVLTAIDDSFTVHRARQSCRTTRALLALERDHAVRLAGEAWRRTGLLARIARDVSWEAFYPLRARIESLLRDDLRRAFFR